jgi:hypothetical protein
MGKELPTRELRDAARVYGDLMADLGVGPQSHAAWQQFCDAADKLDEELNYLRGLRGSRFLEET